MNAVEIEEAVSEFEKKPFNPKEFPYGFLLAYGNKNTTIKKIKEGSANKSDLNGVLQRNNIHIVTCEENNIEETFLSLKKSQATRKHKVKFILATDGKELSAEDLISGEILSCEYGDLSNHFCFFLPLAGIFNNKEINENSIDIKATGRLNKLYLELLKNNPGWGGSDMRKKMNSFMARLIFCFFAEDTEIFGANISFTNTIQQISDSNAANTDYVIDQIFQAMNLPNNVPKKSCLPKWASLFPYVNGGLFSSSLEIPKFSRIARSYLIHIGHLDWVKINPDIFGSMIQAVSNDDERGSLGMHYTSVPSILKVLNPLFLDEIRFKLKEAKGNSRKLTNLRNRLSKIRIFDPACGSGNFLVIAYKEMRKIENEINREQKEFGRKSQIPLTNFRGIEISSFSCEIARLALIIAEYQCNELYLGQLETIAEFLPLDSINWITCGNALKLDWSTICPDTGSKIKTVADDLFSTPLDQTEIDFKNEGGITYLCGNPPYKGSKWQTNEQKNDLANAWREHPNLAKTTDFVTGWIAKYLDYSNKIPNSIAAFVMTNSICQGLQASLIWPEVFKENIKIIFAHSSFKWRNLAAHNAGVTVVIVGMSKNNKKVKRIFENDLIRECSDIGPYLIPNQISVVRKMQNPLSSQSRMLFGNMPRDGGFLFLSYKEAKTLLRNEETKKYVKRFMGSEELINGKQRFCLWIEDEDLEDAQRSEFIKKKLLLVAKNRSESKAKSTRDFAKMPHRFVQIAGKAIESTIIVPRVSSENRQYYPVDYLTKDFIIGDSAQAIYDAPLWNFSIVASKLHLTWIATVCGKLENRFRYSNTLGWNTFPIPKLTEKNIDDLNTSAENILIAREENFPSTLAELYNPSKMPQNLIKAHKENDEMIERIYIGRKFRNDTERLEQLFKLYNKLNK